MTFEHSRHARVRMQQRGIAAHAIEQVLCYGRERHDGRGGIVVMLDRRAKARLAREARLSGAAVDRLAGVYVVVAEGLVCTVGHRRRRLRHP